MYLGLLFEPIALPVNVTLSSVPLLLNAVGPMLVKLAGNVMDVNAHDVKAPVPIAFSDVADAKFTSDNAVQPLNASKPMDVSVAGKTTVVSCEHP